MPNFSERENLIQLLNEWDFLPEESLFSKDQEYPETVDNKKDLIFPFLEEVDELWYGRKMEHEGEWINKLILGDNRLILSTLLNGTHSSLR